MAFCIMNVAKFSGADMASGGLEHEWMREPKDEARLSGSLSSNIDWSRTGMNFRLFEDGRQQPAGPLCVRENDGRLVRMSLDKIALRNYEMVQRYNEKHGVKRRKMRKDATHLVSTVYSASPEWMAKHVRSDGTLDEVGTQYFRDCLAFDLAQGGLLVTAVVHLDETTPHMHVIKTPVVMRESVKKQKDGTTVKTERLAWSAKDLLGGRKQLSAAQTRFAKEVGRKYGLERGEMTVAQDESAYVAGEVRHNRRKNPEQYRADLNDELKGLERETKAARAALEDAQRKSAQLQQQVARYDEQKRMADDEERRKKDARAECKKVKAETEALRDERKALRDDVKRLEAQKAQLLETVSKSKRAAADALLEAQKAEDDMDRRQRLLEERERIADERVQRGVDEGFQDAMTTARRHTDEAHAIAAAKLSMRYIRETRGDDDELVRASYMVEDALDDVAYDERGMSSFKQWWHDHLARYRQFVQDVLATIVETVTGYKPRQLATGAPDNDVDGGMSRGDGEPSPR